MALVSLYSDERQEVMGPAAGPRLPLPLDPRACREE